MKQKILITFGSPYDMITEEGDRLTGCSLQYFFFGDGGKDFAVMRDNGGGEAIGHKVMKSSVPVEERANLIAVPGVYEGEFEMTVNGQMKPVLKLIHIEYVESISFTSAPVDAFGDVIKDTTELKKK